MVLKVRSWKHVFMNFSNFWISGELIHKNDEKLKQTPLNPVVWL
jgi:hypothetical protein